jgi:hypothetical protein
MEQTQQNNIDKDIAWASKLSSDIFKHGALINVSIGFWSGQVRQTPEDQKVLGVKEESEFYQPGYKWLIPRKYTTQFSSFRVRLGNFMERISYRVPGMRGARFVPKNAYPQLKNFLNNQKECMFKMRDDFLEKYPEIVSEQISKFNEKYPEHIGYLDAFYPPADNLIHKFNYSWTLYSWAQTEIAEIAVDAKNHLSEKAAQLVFQAGLQIRNHIIEATESVVNAIRNGKHCVNIRTVKSFVERLNELKQINLFNDPEVEKILNGACNSITSVSSWKKDEVDSCNLEAVLSRIVKDVKNDVAEIEKNPEKMLVIKRAIELSGSEDTIDDSNNVEIVRTLSRSIEIENEE